MTEPLAAFSNPRSVAVVGASADPTKWGYWIARGALRGAHRREVHLVNARGAVIAGHPTVRSLSDIEVAPELVVLCAPARSVPGLVDEALALGVKGLLVISAQIDAVNDQPGLEQLLAARIRAAGARIVGPNCLGIYDAATDLELTWGNFVPGSVAIVSQSGQLSLELAGLAGHAGLGVSRFVSVGNQVDVNATELLADLVTHDATKAVVLYLESFAKGRDLMAVMAELRAAGKPVVVLTVGASDASRDAARSHTGALTTSTDIVEAACRAAGAVFVQTPAQAIDLAHLLLGSPLPRGPRVAVVSDSGGQGALAADTLNREGLVLPRLSSVTAKRLGELLPAGAGVANPVDLAGAGEQNLDTYSRTVEILLGSGEVDTVVLSGYFGCYGSDTPALVDRELEVVAGLAASVRLHQRPVLVHSMGYGSDAVRHLRSQAVPALPTIDAVARALAQATAMGEVGPSGVAQASGPVAEVGQAVDYLAGRDRLREYGIRYPRACAVRTPEQVHAAAHNLHTPLVLKAGWLAHKTEVDGVKVGLPTLEVTREAVAEMSSRLGEGPYVIEEMDTRGGTVDLIVGARRDSSFGPVVLVGLGGVHAEIYRDVALSLAPVTPAEALRMIESLQCLPLLQGFRGRPVVDIAAAADVVVAVSRLVAEQPDIVECEINPLRVGPLGGLAVDALVVAGAPPVMHRQDSRLKEVAR